MEDYVTTSYDPSLMYTTGLTEIAQEQILTGIMAFAAAYFFVLTLVAIFMIIVQWKIFAKAGKPGWAALVPIYNTIVYFQICGLNPWLLVLCVIPVVNFVALPILMLMATINLAKAFGKGVGFIFGMIFLPIIFLPILAFGKAQYNKVL